MFQRAKNHPCVIVWSLGNESGWGPNFAACAEALRRWDPRRPVQYEGAEYHGDAVFFCGDGQGRRFVNWWMMGREGRLRNVSGCFRTDVPHWIKCKGLRFRFGQAHQATSFAQCLFTAEVFVKNHRRRWIWCEITSSPPLRAEAFCLFWNLGTGLLLWFCLLQHQMPANDQQPGKIRGKKVAKQACQN